MVDKTLAAETATATEAFSRVREFMLVDWAWCDEDGPAETIDPGTGPIAALPTETLRPNAATLTSGTANGGSVPAILADDNTGTYVDAGGDDITITGIGFPDLTGAAGRDIESFTISLLGGSTNAGGDTITVTLTGATAAGSPDTVALDWSTWETPVVAGPFTKSGGGDFTEAQINSISVTVATASTDYVAVYDIWLTVTYAT